MDAEKTIIKASVTLGVGRVLCSMEDALLYPHLIEGRRVKRMNIVSHLAGWKRQASPRNLFYKRIYHLHEGDNHLFILHHGI